MTFGSFTIAGWTPLLPYILSFRPLFEFSVMTTAVVFFLVGASRTFVTNFDFTVQIDDYVVTSIGEPHFYVL